MVPTKTLQPTGQPTSGPSYISKDMFLFSDIGNSTQYWCHPRHVHSTGNQWQPVFGAVSLDSKHTTNLVQIRTWVVDHVAGTDGFSMLPGAFQELYENTIQVNATSDGAVLTLRPLTNTRQGEFFGSPVNWNTSYVSNDVWGQLVHMIGYKLGRKAYNCDDYAGTTKTIGLQGTDRFGRVSNAIYVKMVVVTAGVLFTNTNGGFTITNDASVEVQLETSWSLGGPVSAGVNVSWGAGSMP
jgi:hypothetical protein